MDDDALKPAAHAASTTPQAARNPAAAAAWQREQRNEKDISSVLNSESPFDLLSTSQIGRDHVHHRSHSFSGCGLTKEGQDGSVGRRGNGTLVAGSRLSCQMPLPDDWDVGSVRQSLKHKLSDSKDALADDFLNKSAEDIIKRFRWLRALSKRHERITERLEDYWRIKVQVDSPKISFFVVANKWITINQLTHQIEAEYAFKFLLPRQGENGEYEVDPSTSERTPLQCGLLQDKNMCPLRFDETLESVLDFDETVYAMNVFSDIFQFTSHSPSAAVSVKVADTADVSESEHPVVKILQENSTLLREAAESLPESHDENSLEAVTDETENLLKEPSELLSVPSERAGGSRRVSQLRRRQRGSQCTTFRPISMTDPAATLDDRFRAMFRNKMYLQCFQEFCAHDRSVENLLYWLEVEILQSCPPHLQLQYGQYVYYLYLAPSAPLRINVVGEVLDDATCPVEGKRFDGIMFDEAQQHVYASLKGHSFTKFERSRFFAGFMDQKEQNDQNYRAAKMTRSFFEELQPSMELRLSLLNSFGENSKAPFATEEREKALNCLIQSLFPDSKSLPLKSYFATVERGAGADRRKRIQKEKKISKFFGERPSYDQLQGQQLRILLTLPTSESSSEESLQQRESTNPELVARRRRLEKLNGFFGQNLGNIELARGNNPAPPVRVETPEANYFSGTRNDLDPEEKRRLAKQAKKLALLMGDASVSAYLPTTSPKEKPEVLFDEGDLERRVGKEIDEFLDGLLSDGEQDIDNKRHVRRKKLSKLSAILGETRGAVETAEVQESRKGQEVAASNKPLSDEERQQQMRRAIKLEKMMGQVVPAKMLGRRKSVEGLDLSEEVVVTEEQPKRDGIREVPPTSVPQVLEGPQSDTMDKDGGDFCESTDRLGLPVSRQSVATFRHRANIRRISVLLSDNRIDKAVDLMDKMMDADLDSPTEAGQLQKSQRQKKLLKLHKFFGNKLDAAQLFEQNIVRNLAQMIEDEVVDPLELAALRHDLDELRDKVQCRKSDLNEELQRRALKEAHELTARERDWPAS
ncbi:hypothetical protein DFJ73DRAFT_856033 [Zopfochytrium polystomum]|nr:hypothetical protein DFJ73DRAFT_856033 [Zopfochytrium polystomum]